mmetsp:Transcript_120916/g.376564  ORF Transcript_120916/g.376564 Transcript_120916/m.376564 type:complete len:295 (+) Transcript_120916:81-965(+)
MLNEGRHLRLRLMRCALIKAFLQQRNQTVQGTPVVELRPRAIPLVVVGCLVRREVLADVPVAPPLAQHQGGHLLAQRLARGAHLLQMVVPLQAPVGQLGHGAPDVATPIPERGEGRVASVDRREAPVAVVAVACKVPLRRNAEMLGREKPLLHHGLGLVIGGRAGQQRVEAGGRDPAVEGAVPEPVREDAPRLVPELPRNKLPLPRGPLPEPAGLGRPPGQRRELRQGLGLLDEQAGHANVVQLHLAHKVAPLGADILDEKVPIVHGRVVQAGLQPGGRHGAAPVVVHPHTDGV